MLLGLLTLAAAAAGAVCALLCLRELRAGRKKQAELPAPEGREEDEGDTALREGILNLMRYTPGGEKKEEA